MHGDLAERLKTLFGEGVDAPLDDGRFGALALEVFRHQCRTNPVYGRFAAGRVGDPAAVSDWRRIPPVPTSAFKAMPLVSGDPRAVERVFRTSGTSRGSGRRGEHHVPDLGLYRASLLPNARAHLLPDGGRIRILSLLPPPRLAPDSSLSYMVGVLVEEVGAPGSGWFVDPDAGLDVEGLRRAVDIARRDGVPVLLAGAAFSFVHWTDALERGGPAGPLPPASRIMETGGFKGRSREMAREELYTALEAHTGVPEERIVNEYGMTELLSQFYEPVLRSPGSPRRLVGPPWVRTRVLDPVSLEPLPEGEPGLLAHLDLANLGSVAAVLTEDLGVAVEGGGFRVLGRAEGAEPRGCSIAVDELLSVARGLP